MFEIRNMIPGLGQRQRFRPNEWRPLADYLIALVGTLNYRRGQVQTPLTTAALGQPGPAQPANMIGGAGPLAGLAMGQIL